ncbi:MAG TPA: hypothetical protein VGD45_33945 [Steroidobacter sp.]|uniref:hypothetical protein n=1 Tax=Steroidobacter sp. TaxID=1978227 RepID=UPI002ED9C32C
MRTSDLSLRVSLRKQPCVLDPTLILAHPHGPELAMRLTQVLEPWLTRSFWQIIDSSELLERQRPFAAAAPAPDSLHLQTNAAALSSWIALRDRTDASSWPLRWVGDNLIESQLGDDACLEIVERYEHLARALEDRAGPGMSRSHSWHHGIHPLFTALDTVALSATLGGALILCEIPTRDAAPWPVQAMSLSGIQPLRIDQTSNDSLFDTEREWVRDVLVTAGLSVVAQRLPPLAIVHVLTDDVTVAQIVNDCGDTPVDPWSSAHAWWYVL